MSSSFRWASKRPPAVTGAPREALGLPSAAFVMVTIGRLVARKSTLQLVQALASCDAADVHLVVVGDGPDMAILQSAAAAPASPSGYIFWAMSAMAQKYRALAAADIFVSTSQHEGFGLVFLEAMAFGLPVVCYDRGGQTDFLKSRETGHVIKLNDLADFTRAIVELHDTRCAARDWQNNLQRVEAFLHRSLRRALRSRVRSRHVSGGAPVAK
jgi:glycosyltransferase involved in cell wall biosynthesis